MVTRIIKIGNSQGIRIPKPILDQTGLQGNVEIEVDGDKIVIRPSNAPRTGWDQAFKKMAQNQDDQLKDDDWASAPVWDEDEWEW